MEPHLSINDKIMFYKYLDKIKVYFEYGSGGSTVQANIRNNIIKIYTVESDIVWFNLIKKNTNNNIITYIFNNMDTIPNKWGRPGLKATNQQKINYSSQLENLTSEEKRNIDLILIDGRFRVACCLKSYNNIKDDCLIAFDDFLDRPHYHVVLKYFDIIDSTSDNRMVILKKKKNMIIPIELIKEYELIYY